MTHTKPLLVLPFFLLLACKPAAEPSEADSPAAGTESTEGTEAAGSAETATGTDEPESAPTADPTATAEAAGTGDAAPEALPGSRDLPGGWTAVNLSDLTGAQAAALARGRATRARVATQLITGLVEAMGEGDASALRMCSIAATGMLDDGSVPANVKLGRTSHRLRNPANVPPVWASEHVAAESPEPLIAVGPDGQVGDMVPIRTQGLCLACHGAADSIAPDVTQALLELYPEDQATGFVDQQLRGWFWVEVTPG